MNFCVVSAHRTGSRWLSQILCDYFGLEFTAEFLGAYTIPFQQVNSSHLSRNRLLKIHPHYLSVTNMIENDWKIKAIVPVRNPRDRLVSYGLHWRYFPNKDFPHKHVASDLDAIKISWGERLFIFEEAFQFHVMENYPNVRNATGNIAWTTYEDLSYGTNEEVSNIVNFLYGVVNVSKMHQAINNNSFNRLAKRTKGTENKNDIRHRKGIVGDYVNYFDNELMSMTENSYNRYEELRNK